MVATIRTWNFDHNFVIAGATVLEQYQNNLFRMKTHALAAGGTVIRSCGGPSVGALVFSAADNWTAATDIQPNSAGLGHSHIEIRGPGVNPWYMLLDCVTTLPATPAQFQLAVAATTFSTGGSTTARPTSATETAAYTLTWLSSTSVVPRRLHGWRSDVGDLLYVGVTDGQGSPYAGILITRLANGESNLTHPWYIYATTSTTNPGGAFASGSFYNTSNWRTFGVGPVPISGGVNPSSAAQFMSAWVGGVSNANSRIGDMPIDGVVNSATLGSYGGRFIDIRGAPNNLASGTSQAPQDPDPIVRKSVGGIWMPVLTGTVLQS